MIKGWILLGMVFAAMVVSTLSFSAKAEAYNHYTLVDSWETSSQTVCLYENVRGDQTTVSITKGRSCPRYHEE